MKFTKLFKIMSFVLLFQSCTQLVSLPMEGPNSWRELENKFWKDMYDIYTLSSIADNIYIDLGNNENVDYINTVWTFESLLELIQKISSDKKAANQTVPSLKKVSDYKSLRSWLNEAISWEEFEKSKVSGSRKLPEPEQISPKLDEPEASIKRSNSKNIAIGTVITLAAITSYIYRKDIAKLGKQLLNGIGSGYKWLYSK